MWEATGATDLGADRPGASERNPLLKPRVRTPNRYRAFRGKIKNIKKKRKARREKRGKKEKEKNGEAQSNLRLPTQCGHGGSAKARGSD